MPIQLKPFARTRLAELENKLVLGANFAERLVTPKKYAKKKQEQHP